MLGQKKFLEACRVTMSASVSEEDGSEPEPRPERGLRSRENILRDPEIIYYKCKSCDVVFSKPVQCIVHYWKAHACNECPNFPERFNYSSMQNHHLKIHHCPYKYQSFSGYYDKFWAELALPSATNCEAEDIVCYTYEIRTNVEVVADLRPILIYKCGTCDLTFENFSQLRVHVLCHHYCLSCSTYHLNRDILLYHHEKKHGNSFDCFRCTPRLEFPNKSSLVTHFLLKHCTRVSVTLTNGLGKPCAKEHHPVLLQQHINRHVRVQSTTREKNRWSACESYNHDGHALEKSPMFNIYQYRIELKPNLTSDDGTDASKKCKGLAVSIELVGASNDVDSKTESWARQLHAKRQETVRPDLWWLLTKHWRLLGLHFHRIYATSEAKTVP